MSDRLDALREVAGSIVRGHTADFCRFIDAAGFSESDLRQAFFYASVYANYDMAKYLLAKVEPDIDLLDRSLQGAAASGNTRFIRWLESLGADRRACEDLAFGLSTFRNRAVTSGYLILKSRGVANDRLEKSLRKAYARGYRGLALGCARLVTECTSLEQAMLWSMRVGRNEFVLSGLLAGGDPNFGRGEFLLQAVRSGNVPLLRILVAQGGDVLRCPPLVLTVEAKASGNPAMVKEITAMIARARKVPHLIRANELVPTRGLKTIAGPAAFS